MVDPLKSQMKEHVKTLRGSTQIIEREGREIGAKTKKLI